MDGNGNDLHIGTLINQKLTEKKLTRQGFCDMYEIPVFRLNRMARGEKIHKKDYGRIARLLNLKDKKDSFFVNGKMSKIKERGKIDRTPLGWEIKRKLSVLNMTQKQFCEVYGIPPGRMAEIVTGKRLAKKHRRRIIFLLGIDETEFRPEGERY